MACLPKCCLPSSRLTFRHRKLTHIPVCCFPILPAYLQAPQAAAHGRLLAAAAAGDGGGGASQSISAGPSGSVVSLDPSAAQQQQSAGSVVSLDPAAVSAQQQQQQQQPPPGFGSYTDPNAAAAFAAGYPAYAAQQQYNPYSGGSEYGQYPQQYPQQYGGQYGQPYPVQGPGVEASSGPLFDAIKQKFGGDYAPPQSEGVHDMHGA